MSDATAPLDESPAEPTWHRVHRITPLVRGWVVLVPLGYAILQQALESGSDGQRFWVRAWWVILLVLLVVGVVTVGWAWIAWRRMWWAVDDDAVHMRSGVVFRQHRKARLDRVQAIDISQPLLARIVGLAELRVEVAGGGDSQVRIGFIELAEAEALRRDLLGRIGGGRAEGAADVTEAADGDVDVPSDVTEEAPVVDVPAGRLLASILRSGAFLVFVTGAIILAVVSRWWPVGVIAIPLGLSTIPVLFGMFNANFGFKAFDTDEGMRLCRGLTETRTQTILRRRVQALGITQTLLWRDRGWWKVAVNVAGYAGGRPGDDDAGGTVLPVGTDDDVAVVLALVAPIPERTISEELIEAGLRGEGAAGGFVTVPRRARLLDPFTWRRRGLVLTDDGVLIRGGRFTRTLVLVPFDRIQSVSVEQGPLDRRLGLAGLSLHSTPGPVTPSFQHLAWSDAAHLRDEIVGAAQAARRLE